MKGIILGFISCFMFALATCLRVSASGEDTVSSEAVDANANNRTFAGRHVMSAPPALPDHGSLILYTDTAVAMDPDSIYTVVDEMAEYPGGMKALNRFLSHNIRYPANARRYGVQGTVYVSFVIEKDGSISSPQIVKGISADLDDESLRVVALFPAWIPAKNHGSIVRARFVLPLIYKLAEPKRIKRKDYH